MKLTKRGEKVLAVSLALNALVILALAFVLMDHVNWVGDRYCFKSSLECYFPEGGSK